MKKKYIIIIIIVVILLTLGSILNNRFEFINFGQSLNDSKRIYTQGLNDIQSNNLQNAYYNFSKISKFSPYYEAALFRQGLLATELNDNESAIKAYEALLNKYPYTFFAQKAIYNLAVAYYNSNQKERAFSNFKLIIKKYPKSDYAHAAQYFLGVLDSDKHKDNAEKYFLNYLKFAPGGKYSLTTIDYLKKLNDKYSPEENLIIGISLIKNEKYNQSILYLENSDINDSWAYLTIAKIKTGDYKSAKKLFIEGISKYSQNSSQIQQEAIENYVQAFGKNKIQELKAIKSLCDEYNCKLNDYIMYNLLSSVDKKTKIEYYNRIYEEFPQGNYAADALFNSMFNDYLAGNYENAIIKGKKHISKYADKKSAPANLYWLARTYDKKRNYIEANSYYNKIFSDYTDSYYSYLAIARLNKITDPYNLKSNNKIPKNKVNIDIPILHTNLSINSSKIIEDLINIKDFKIFEYTDFDNEIIKSWVAYYEGDLAKASVIAEDVLSKSDVKPPLDDDIYKLIYPIGYSELINKNSGELNNIAPYLLLALIRKESHFNPAAVSSTGALGLMQLMPKTASYIANLTGTIYKKSDLYNPEYNIYLGVKYYDYIKKNHHSNDLYALASYNGGHGTVSKWKNEISISEPDEFVEKIPYPETKEYIKQIYQNYWVYSCIYNSAKVK